MAPRAYGARTTTSRIGWLRSIGNLAVSLGLNTERFQGGILRAVGSLTSLRSVGVSAGLAVGAALVQGLIEASAERAQFEYAMQETFNLLPGMSEKAMTAMSDQVRTFARESAITLQDAAESAYQAVSAGVNIEQNPQFLKDADDLAKAWRTGTTEAVTSLATVLNAWGASMSEAGDYADALFTIVQKGVVRGEELTKSFSKLTTTSSSLSISIEEVGAAVAVLTKQGATTSQAITRMNQLFVQLSRSGSKTADFFAEVTGVSFPAFMASGRKMIDIIPIMNREMNRLGLTAHDVFGRNEAALGFIALASEQGAAQYEDAAQSMADNSGVVADAADAMRDTLVHKWAEVRSEIGAAVDEIMPQLLSLGDTFADLVADAAPLLAILGLMAEQFSNVADILSFEEPGGFGPGGGKREAQEKAFESRLRSWFREPYGLGFGPSTEWDEETKKLHDDLTNLDSAEIEQWGLSDEALPYFMEYYMTVPSQESRELLRSWLPEDSPLKAALDTVAGYSLRPAGEPFDLSIIRETDPEKILQNFYDIWEDFDPAKQKALDDNAQMYIFNNAGRARAEALATEGDEEAFTNFTDFINNNVSSVLDDAGGDIDAGVKWFTDRAGGSLDPSNTRSIEGTPFSPENSEFARIVKALPKDWGPELVEQFIRSALLNEQAISTYDTSFRNTYNPRTSSTSTRKTPLEEAVEDAIDFMFSSGDWQENLWDPTKQDKHGSYTGLSDRVKEVMGVFGIPKGKWKDFIFPLHDQIVEKGELDWLEYHSPDAIADRAADQAKADEEAERDRQRKEREAISLWNDQVRAEEEAWRGQRSAEDALSSAQSNLWGTYETLFEAGLVDSMDHFFELIKGTPEMLDLRNKATRAGETWDDALEGVKEVGLELKNTVDGVFEEMSRLANYHKQREDTTKGHARGLVEQLIAMEVDPQHWGAVGEWFFSKGHFPGLGMMGKDRLKSSFNTIAADMLPFALNPVYDQEDLEKFLEGLGWENPNGSDTDYNTYGAYNRYQPSTGVLRLVEAAGFSAEGLRQQQCDTTAAIYEQTEVIKKGNQVLHNDNVKMARGGGSYSGSTKIKPDTVPVLR